MDLWTGSAPLRRADLLAAGVSAKELYGAVAAGHLTRLRRGIYLPARLRSSGAGPGAPDEFDRHLDAVRGALCRLHTPVVVSHLSAAALHGLEPWGLPMRRVHVTRDRPTGARRRSDLDLHASPLTSGEIVSRHGIAVTSVPRTVVDVARSVPFEQAVVVADAALRLEGATVGSLHDALHRARGWPGVTAAERVVRFADGRSASVGESRSRVRIHQAGLPVPDLQHNVVDSGGEWLARVDFRWDGTPPVIGEFDGKGKYGRMLRPGQKPGDVVFEEKRREDALRRAGSEVVRWTWDDLDEFAPTAAHLRRLLRY
ncbi:type IV toxin-antitoxin system AbiEi family antitoxin domain-containing protein [Pseudonocardia sp. KRD291]|uniref:type IV toxin-antitoxin system AbiEi family antitoxin domain-containing protein n=1 Tax=Pseudonocardia sp. KRD291 TaxID=2792007 RepID=UPI001C49F68B|nr:type IV toxin-antitoxin system AbiEi family antitoxin domain-containing protein [Pseudonocardia sp. KRD291]MBW0101581.1 type IV toxin-antitoxin system AbiEi family antitoxin domain-containing protein [Pseudonocardia sp. KRD291]